MSLVTLFEYCVCGVNQFETVDITLCIPKMYNFYDSKNFDT